MNSGGMARASMRNGAVVAGFGLLLMTILAIYANFAVLETLIVPGNAAATSSHIAASMGQFRLATGCLLAIAMLDIAVAWGLYIVLAPASRALSLLAAWFRVAYAAVFASALANLARVPQLLDGQGYSSAFSAEQMSAQVMGSVDAFTSGWGLGLGVFGVHLLLVGYVASRATYVPKWLGAVLLLAGLGYLVDSLGKVLSAGYGLEITMFTFVGELLLLFWLLWKGFKGFSTELEAAAQTASG